MIKGKLKNLETGIEKNQDILKNQVSSKNIILALGSNLDSKYGNKIKNLEIAQLLLISNGIYIIKKSCYYESLSDPNYKDPKFINCVLEVQTNLKPIYLINIIFKIEKFLGRNRKNSIKNKPRVCDIDIIDYKGKTINYYKKLNNLIIPHKLMHKRSFVLIPLLEILPNWIHPKFKVNINSLLEKNNISNLNNVKKV